MTKVILVAWLMSGGIWYPGEFFDGWAPIELDNTYEECVDKLPELNSIDPNLMFECHLVEVK